MDRWTMRELKDTDDITFAICILEERRRGLTPYSPLGMKLKEAAHTLSRIKDETDKYMTAIHEVCNGEQDGEQAEAEYPDDECGEDMDVPTTDLSNCDEETKATILANAELLEARENEAEGGAEDEIA